MRDPAAGVSRVTGTGSSAACRTVYSVRQAVFCVFGNRVFPPGTPLSIFNRLLTVVLSCLSLGYPLVVIGQKMVSGIDSWLLIAIPLFILAGNLMNAGMSGSASADAGGLGAIEIKAMRDHGYDDDFSAAVTAASSVIDSILPPSIPLIIY